MRKMKFMSFTLLIVLLLAACTGKPLKAANENSMVIHITNNAEFEYKTIEVSVLQSTGGSLNADGSNIKKGEALQFEYIDQEDFALDGEATFEYVVIDEHGKKSPLQKVTLELAKNKDYYFEITGDKIEEAVLKSVE